MKTYNHRRAFSACKKLAETHGASCTMCDKPFSNNAKCYGGLRTKRFGPPELVGECCRDKLAEIVVETIHYDMGLLSHLLPILKSGALPPADTMPGATSIDQAIAHVDLAQRHFVDGLLSKAGLPTGARTKLGSWGTAADHDDQAWFDARPDRRHRARVVMPCEYPAMFPDATSDDPPDPESVVLIRRVPPDGWRRIVSPVTPIEAFSDHELFLSCAFDVCQNIPDDEDAAAYMARRIPELAEQRSAAGRA